jgi:phage-related protein
MGNIQKEIILESCRKLSESTRRNWSGAGFDEWAEYAKKMKNTIETVVPILSSIANSDEKESISENAEIRSVISKLAAELNKNDLVEILKGNVKIDL